MGADLAFPLDSNHPIQDRCVCDPTRTVRREQCGAVAVASKGESVSKGAIAEQPAGSELFDTTEKVFPDVKAEPGEKAFTFMHTVPYEGSVGLVNLLTTTRLLRKGFETNLVLYGPGVLMASGTRGFPKVGDEAFPGHMAINNQIKTFLDEGGTVYACRFACGALYGFPEDLLMDGVTPFHPLDVLDAALTAWRDKAFQLNTWTV
jgi:uncharacterized repeat protein (TIGR04044 family)